jgi:hypothetical protein
LKLLLALLALMLAAGLASFWLWRRAPVPAPCPSREIARSRSPDNRAQADVFEVRCGDTAATHVALRLAGAPEQARADVFVAPGSVPVRLVWTGPRELLVQSGAERVYVEETRWRDVAIRVRRDR